MDMAKLTWLHGRPQSTGVLKANPEDFVVVEDLGFAPDGEGEHVLVNIRKTAAIPSSWPTIWRASPVFTPVPSAMPA